MKPYEAVREALRKQGHTVDSYSEDGLTMVMVSGVAMKVREAQAVAAGTITVAEVAARKSEK